MITACVLAMWLCGRADEAPYAASSPSPRLLPPQGLALLRSGTRHWSRGVFRHHEGAGGAVCAHPFVHVTLCEDVCACGCSEIMWPVALISSEALFESGSGFVHVATSPEFPVTAGGNVCLLETTCQENFLRGVLLDKRHPFSTTAHQFLQSENFYLFWN